MMLGNLPYHIGCPVWASAAWIGKLFAPDAPRGGWLSQYASAFNTVEGNSTFYGLPTSETVRRWAAETPAGFHFVLKFPRSISHDRQLVAAGEETRIFLDILHLLAKAGRLGPSMLQLPPKFAAKQFGDLERYLRSLPKEFPYAVEVRHWQWFDESRFEERLNLLLMDLGIDRVLFDSRPLFAFPPADDAEDKAQRQKPRSPPRRTVTGMRPVLRLIGRNDPDSVMPWIAQWAPVVALWINQGLSPYVITHAPDDRYAPDLARLFHAHLQRELPELGRLPPWPAETVAQQPKQALLF